MFGLRAPDDALVKIRDSDAVVSIIKEEKQLILRLGHMIDAARTRRVKNFVLDDIAAVVDDLNLQIAFRDFHTERAVTVNAHRAQMYQMNVELGFDDRA